MSGSASRLPPHPSLEQLRKQAKDLLRALRSGDDAALQRVRAIDPRLADHCTLSDAQFVIAREYGFESWPKLVHDIEDRNPPGVRQLDDIADRLVAAYTSGNFTAIRELNWTHGTAYVWHHDVTRMQLRLPNWFASESRSMDIALADARHLVAKQTGFESWDELVASLARSSRKPPSTHVVSPFYRIDCERNSIEARGPLGEKEWDTVFAVMKELRVTTLHVGGQITDSALERLSQLDQITHLELGGAQYLTYDGLRHLARLPRLQALDLGGWGTQISDDGLRVLRDLPQLRVLSLMWAQRVSDAGIANLADSMNLEFVNLMGTPTGDGSMRALTGKPDLRRFDAGTRVTEAGLALLHQFPAFKQSGAARRASDSDGE